MPKETISTPTGPYHAKVGWSHEQGVQVGVGLVSDERSLFWVLLGDETVLAGLGAEVRMLAATGTQPGVLCDDRALGEWVLSALDTASQGGYFGLSSDLDRKGCNDLIRILRRARDSAFGRDE